MVASPAARRFHILVALQRAAGSAPPIYADLSSVTVRSLCTGSDGKCEVKKIT
jgi:hypothetical protein